MPGSKKLTMRETIIARIALSYMLANLDDVIECFVEDDPDTITYQGHVIPNPIPMEFQQLWEKILNGC